VGDLFFGQVAALDIHLVSLQPPPLLLAFLSMSRFTASSMAGLLAECAGNVYLWCRRVRPVCRIPRLLDKMGRDPLGGSRTFMIETLTAESSAHVRHEYRTFVNHIIGYSEFGERHLESRIPAFGRIQESGRELLASIQGFCQRLAFIISSSVAPLSRLSLVIALAGGLASLPAAQHLSLARQRAPFFARVAHKFDGNPNSLHFANALADGYIIANTFVNLLHRDGTRIAMPNATRQCHLES
jgi:signal transduction histidine kinase